jgi:hypothetical protein
VNRNALAKQKLLAWHGGTEKNNENLNKNCPSVAVIEKKASS